MGKIALNQRMFVFSLKSTTGLFAGMVCVFIFLCFSAPSAFSLDTGIIKLAGFDYPPFFSQGINEIHGIGADLGKELFRRIGLETELTLYPLQRALNYMKKGTVDAVISIIRTPEREQYLIYTIPLIPGKGYIWSAADRKGGPINFEGLGDLRPYKVGVTVGYSYGGPMDELLKSMNTDSATREYYSFKKLMAHRIDIIPATDIVVQSMVKNHPEFIGKFSHSDKPFLESEYYMGISKKSRLVRMIPQINEALTAMKNENFMDRVVSKYTDLMPSP
jgi:polar amino acid transport system substrate-binding protein